MYKSELRGVMLFRGEGLYMYCVYTVAPYVGRSCGFCLKMHIGFPKSVLIYIWVQRGEGV